mgnify:CR=1 FL=1
MVAIFINFLAIIIGSAIGAVARRGIREKSITVLNTAMGLTAIVLGINVAIESMQTSQYPILFIFCLSLGGLLGTLLQLDTRLERATSRLSSGGELSKGITTSILLCCVGTLAIMGPVNSALSGDNTFLMTLATMNLVTMVVMASTYGFGVAITSVVVFLWLSGIYGIATLSAEFISPQLTSEISIVGGILIAASGLGVLNIKDCKTINLLPALLMPMLFFLGKRVIEMIF